MTTASWLLPSIILWLLQKSNAGPVMRNKNYIHYTNIGDISPKDILHMVDEATPADKRFISPDQMEVAEGNMETEKNHYYQNDHPSLDSPNDEEQKFVHLLKKHYKGTFPEYNKETTADFARNRELDENLNAQPETVFLGHSDIYHGKNGKSEDTGDIEDVTVDPLMSNDAFDSNANPLYSFNTGRFNAKIHNPTKVPFRTTSQHHRENHPTDDYNKEITNELNTENDYLSDYLSGDEDEHLSTDKEQELSTDKEQKLSTDKEQELSTDKEQKLSTDKEQKLSTDKEQKLSTDKEQELSTDKEQELSTDKEQELSTDKEQELSTDKEQELSTDKEQELSTDKEQELSTDKEQELSTDKEQELSTDKEQEGMYKVTQKAPKTEDQMVADTEKNTPQKALHDHDKKQKNTKKIQKKKVKSNRDGGPKRIIDEFDDLKGHNKSTQKGHAGIEGNSKQIAGTMSKKPSPKHQPENRKIKKIKKGKKINYIHAEDSQGTNDAILDFLDRLLKKDPKKLRHDVLRMAKAMKNEETMQTGNQDSNPIESKNTKIKNRVKDEDGALRKNVNESKEVEKWISQLVDKNGAEKEETDAISQSENGYKFDDKEYNEHHELPEIYPDHNPGGETTLSESVYDGLGEGKKNDGRKESNKIEEVKEKEQEFDYEEFKEEALKMHNEFRRRHNAVALQWSDELAIKAHEIAKQLISATRNSFKRELERHGQSIAILPYLTKHIAKSAVQKWYSEITKFSFANPEVKPETRDFTQIIWSGSNLLGMGFAYSANKKKTLVVALYTPAGNNPDEMRKNLNVVNYDIYADIRKAAIGRNG